MGFGIREQVTRMRRSECEGFAAGLAVGLLAMPPGMRAVGDDERRQTCSPTHAMWMPGFMRIMPLFYRRAALEALIKALGGDAWLNMKNMEREGHIAGAFHRGDPDPGTDALFFDFLPVV